MTREKLMAENNMDDEEFDTLYEQILQHVRYYGTFGVTEMVRYVENELEEGNETL
jgi:hypothetical protein